MDRNYNIGMRTVAVVLLAAGVFTVPGGATTLQSKGDPMLASHLHLGVKDLAAAVGWLDKVWTLKPTYRDDRMASVPFGKFTIIFDASTTDTATTIGFDSSNCDEDFRAVVSRGGVVLEPPTDRPWGVRSAYIQGPGALRFEIEQLLKR